MKPFSLDGAGDAINLFNIARSRFVRNAPVKGQCAKDYLYGTDLELERLLQDIEGRYARTIRKIQLPASHPSDGDLAVLRWVAFLQYQRTDMAMRRMRLMHEGVHNAMYEGRPVTPPDLDVSDRTMMFMTMSMFAGSQDTIKDLKVCIVKNETDSDFITSDDPAILASKFHAQRLRSNNFGTGSSGVLLIMPLTPRLCLICYDGDVYTIAGKQGSVVPITSRADAFALNELQYIKAAENVYFSRWDSRDRIVEEFPNVSPRRPTTWHKVNVLVPAGFGERGQRYRQATDEERKTAKKTMIVMSTFHPVPNHWISKLKYRDPIRTMFDGSAVGHVRREVWARDQRQRMLREGT